jgi:hypothetical protein
MAAKRGQSWKMERASVTTSGKTRPRSNKYAKSDTGQRPRSGSRQRVWIGGYTKGDGTRVRGYYRSLAGS